jgi:hypothetical protein
MSDFTVEGAQENQRPIDDVHSGEKVLSNNVYKVKETSRFSNEASNRD